MLARGAARGPPGRVDFERGMRHAPPLVLALIAANVLMFIRGPSVGASGAGFGVVAALIYVDNSAHVGGVLGGVVASFLVRPRLLWEQSSS